MRRNRGQTPDAIVASENGLTSLIKEVRVFKVVAHVCGDPLSRYTCRATRVAADSLRILGSFIRADFREGDEDSNFSFFRVRQFTESPGPLH